MQLFFSYLTPTARGNGTQVRSGAPDEVLFHGLYIPYQLQHASRQLVATSEHETAFGRLELEWCERKILLGWLELELVAGVV